MLFESQSKIFHMSKVNGAFCLISHYFGLTVIFVLSRLLASAAVLPSLAGSHGWISQFVTLAWMPDLVRHDNLNYQEHWVLGYLHPELHLALAFAQT